MAPAQLICRIRVDKAGVYDADTEQPENSAVFDLKDCPEVGIEIRTQWAREIVKYFGIIHDSMRPWDFLGRIEGSVKPLPMSVPESGVYPVRFQIPPGTLRELDHHEKVRRAERFAMASLLYEILSGTKPFEELTDAEVQHRFSNADFPDDAISLPNSLLIYSGWSEEFSIAAALVALCLVKAKKTDNSTPMNFSVNLKITKMVPENTMKKSVTNA